MTEKISVEKADTVSEQKAELADSAVQQISMDEDSEELVAVITAAIAASLHRSTHDIVVRFIRRIPAITPVWNRTSRQSKFLQGCNILRNNLIFKEEV